MIELLLKNYGVVGANPAAVTYTKISRLFGAMSYLIFR